MQLVRPPPLPCTAAPRSAPSLPPTCSSIPSHHERLHGRLYPRRQYRRHSHPPARWVLERPGTHAACFIACFGGCSTHLAPYPPPTHAVTLPLLFVVALLAEAFSSWAALGWAALLYGPVLLGTVLIHELGHSLAARKVGGTADGILLWPLGGLAYVGHDCGPKGACCSDGFGRSKLQDAHIC